jgi:hypothetical protein
MRKVQAINKNLDLLDEFMKYAFNNPEILEKIPPDSELVILPKDDPELYKYNKKTADKILSRKGKVVLVKMKKPKIPIPELELMSAIK